MRGHRSAHHHLHVAARVMLFCGASSLALALPAGAIRHGAAKDEHSKHEAAPHHASEALAADKGSLTVQHWQALLLLSEAVSSSDADKCRQAVRALYTASLAACKSGESVEEADRACCEALQILASSMWREGEMHAAMHHTYGEVLDAQHKREQAIASLERGLNMFNAMNDQSTEGARRCMISASKLAAMHASAGNLQGSADAERELLLAASKAGLGNDASATVSSVWLARMEPVLRRGSDLKRDVTPSEVWRNIRQLSADMSQPHFDRTSAQPRQLLDELWVRAQIMAGSSPPTQENEGLEVMRAVSRLVATYFGPEHEKVAQCNTTLAGLLSLDGQHDEALQMWRTAVNNSREQFGDRSIRTLKYQVGYGAALRLAGHEQQGNAELAAAEPMYRAVKGPERDFIETFVHDATLICSTRRQLRSAEAKKPAH